MTYPLLQLTMSVGTRSFFRNMHPMLLVKIFRKPYPHIVKNFILFILYNLKGNIPLFSHHKIPLYPWHKMSLILLTN